MSPPDSTSVTGAESSAATEAAPAVRICPKCQHPVPCYRPQVSVYFGCVQCHHYFHAPTDAPAAVVAGPSRVSKAGPWLALGSVGTLSGYRLRVTGFQLRGEKGDKLAQWGEYQLSPADEATEQAAALDPAFPLQLSEYKGHWLLIRPSRTGPDKVPARMTEWNDPSDGYRGFRLWHRYQPSIIEVRGEFDENVLEDAKLNMVELTSPPYQLLGAVKPGKKYTWYRARYLEAKQVAAAFGVSRDQLPEREGIGAAQPPPGNVSWGRLIQLASAGLVLLLVLQAFLLLRSSPILLRQEFLLAAPTVILPDPNDTTAVQGQRQRLRVMRDSMLALTYEAPGSPPPSSDLALYRLSTREQIRQQYQQQLAALEQARYNAANNLPAAPLTFVSRSFDLADAAALNLDMEAPNLNNGWVELSVSLINEQSGRAYEATRAIEFYSGVESGESWTEGSHSTNVDFNAVPNGRYHVNLYPTADPTRTGPIDLNLKVEVNNSLWSNFFLALLALGLPVILLGIRRSFFEQGRWQNSDYGPQESS